MKKVNNILGFIGAFILFSPVYFLYGVTFLLFGSNAAGNAVEDFFDSFGK